MKPNLQRQRQTQATAMAQIHRSRSAALCLQMKALKHDDGLWACPSSLLPECHSFIVKDINCSLIICLWEDQKNYSTSLGKPQLKMAIKARVLCWRFHLIWLWHILSQIPSVCEDKNVRIICFPRVWKAAVGVGSPSSMKSHCITLSWQYLPNSVGHPSFGKVTASAGFLNMRAVLGSYLLKALAN
jgi:hypothetical protein